MFRTEKELFKFVTQHEIIFDELGLLNNPNYELIFFEEINLGYGIPDLIICKKQIEMPQRRIQLRNSDINILRIIEKTKGVTIEEIHNITKDSLTKVNTSLQNLINEDFVKLVGQKYKIKKKYKIYVNYIVAIEFKLKNWKRALHQAIRYQSFAKYSYVLLDDLYLSPARKNLELFVKHNIGLIGVNKNGSIEIVSKPKCSRPYDIKSKILLNELILSHSFPFKNVSQVSK